MGSDGASIGRPCRWRGIRVAAAVVVSVTVTVAGRAQGPMVLLEDLAGTLRQQPAWTATYHQEYLPAGMTEGEQIDGEVWVAWPDRALFRSGDPVVRLMGLDHRRVRLVDLDVPSCEDHRLSDDEWARIPLAVVLDPKAAVDGFTVIDRGDRSFALVPREPGGVSRVEVVLGSDNLPDRVVVVDPQGASNRLDFGGWRPAAAPPSGAWLPERPAGVSCSGEASELDPAAHDERGRLRR